MVGLLDGQSSRAVDSHLLPVLATAWVKGWLMEKRREAFPCFVLGTAVLLPPPRSLRLQLIPLFMLGLVLT